jgi:hypothetical protein
MCLRMGPTNGGECVVILQLLSDGAMLWLLQGQEGLMQQHMDISQSVGNMMPIDLALQLLYDAN